MNIFDCIHRKTSNECFPQPLQAVSILTSDTPDKMEMYTPQREFTLSLNYNRAVRYTPSQTDHALFTRLEHDFRADLNRLVYSHIERELHNVRAAVYNTHDQDAIEAMTRLMNKVYDR
jgi:hypothetical protein